MHSRVSDLQIRTTIHSSEIFERNPAACWTERLFQGICRTDRDQSLASTTIPYSSAGRWGPSTNARAAEIGHLGCSFLNAIKVSLKANS